MVDLRLIASEEPSQGQNRRAYVRIPFPYSVASQVGGRFEVRDFSPGGVGIVSSERFEDQHFVRFSIAVPGMPEPVPFTCEILWRKNLGTGEHFAGTRFVDQGLTQTITKYLYSAVRDRGNQTVTLTPLTLVSQPEAADRIVAGIQALKLPPFFEELAQRARAFSRRPAYIWKWCYQAMKALTLNSVDSSFESILSGAKFAGFLFSILLDDLADEEKDSRLLDEVGQRIILGKPLNLENVTLKERQTAEFLEDLWRIIQGNMRQFPRYAEFNDLVQYDFEQIFGTLKYSRLSNRYVTMINEQEAVLYEGNNINVMIVAMLDLMCSPGVDVKELGMFREAVWNGQMMCKIANWIATWRREIRVGDWTSGIVAHALRTGVLKYDDLSDENTATIVRAIENSTVEEDFMWKWEKRRRWILTHVDDIKSVDMRTYLKGLETFYQMQLVSRGLQ